MLNTLPVVGQVRQPRAVVKLNGTVVPGWISWEVTNNSYFEADTWRVSFATSGLPDANDAAWFADQTETFVEIFCGFPSNPDKPDPAQLTSMVYGRVDEMRYDPVSTLIDLKGRDLTAAFIDSRLISEYTNQTSSAIVTQLAASHGLSTGNVTATSKPVGVYYQRDHVTMQASRSEWDLIAYLARQEKFVAFVTGQAFYFGPDPLPNSNPYTLKWVPGTDEAPPSANVRSLALMRAQTVAKGITVTVRSADILNKGAVVANYPAAPKAIQAGKATPFGNVQAFSFTLPPGRTAAQCQQYAQARYHEIVSHEMKLEATLPGDTLLTIRQMLELTGTGTAFDQLYFPRTITRRMSKEDGFDMTVSAQNQSPTLPS